MYKKERRMMKKKQKGRRWRENVYVQSEVNKKRVVKRTKKEREKNERHKQKNTRFDRFLVKRRKKK